MCPELHLTLIDEKEYFEYTPMILRAMVKDEYWKTISLSHKHMLGEKNALILGRVTEVHQNHVLVNANK